ncbi:MAG: hypothetical protein PHQ58_04805 [Rhodoferax sp.]|uniref:hypothetical protein n=1 Tax=Rhodoferax sp. TaxID=50421 RepID=UPI00261E53E8|nr:hypothetical protein [Rhodoferax sp.]MDD2879733.1 hypothetical protein [Rhodoferax sp.]
MLDTITLFRGDAEKVGEFDIKRTSKHSLLGRGVYLTNSKAVAGTYRSKGLYSPKGARKILFEGAAKDRKEALELALPHFADDFFPPIPYSYPKPKRDALRKANIEKARSQFYRMVEEKSIVAEYLSSSQGKFLRVSNFSLPEEGYLTEFHFNRREFNTSVIKVDGYIRDEGFWELMWEHKIPVGLEFTTKEAYCNINSSANFNLSRSLMNRVSSHLYGEQNLLRSGLNRSVIFTKIRHALEPYGYRGLEYSGGRYLGGNRYTHRAFCMWDDEFVNDHKVRVIA